MSVSAFRKMFSSLSEECAKTEQSKTRMHKHKHAQLRLVFFRSMCTLFWLRKAYIFCVIAVGESGGMHTYSTEVRQY